MYNLNRAAFGTGNFAISYQQGSSGRKFTSATAFVTQVPDFSEDNSAVPEVSFVIRMMEVTAE